MQNKRDRILIIFQTIIITIIFFSCTTYRGAPTGIWTCEELGITIDFDNDISQRGGMAYRSTIVIDGKTSEIVCGMGPTGEVSFYFVEDMGKTMEEKTYLYVGTFSNARGDTKIFREGRNRTRYTFIRQEESDIHFSDSY